MVYAQIKGGIEEMDIIIPVNYGDDNEELRYCLRSIENNVPHHNIIIAGFKPRWVQNVIHIPNTSKSRVKYDRVAENILAGANYSELSDWFILFNDDMFVMEPVKEFPAAHRGILHEDSISEKAPLHRKSFEDTRVALNAAGIEKPMNYEMHSPMVISKHGLLAVETIKMELAPPERDILQLRSMYGNLHHIGGEMRHDVKIADNATFNYAPDFPFISTTDESFKHGEVGEVIRSRFTEKSRYEAR